jgi:hypothetical protein
MKTKSKDFSNTKKSETFQKEFSIREKSRTNSLQETTTNMSMELLEMDLNKIRDFM